MNTLAESFKNYSLTMQEDFFKYSQFESFLKYSKDLIHRKAIKPILKSFGFFLFNITVASFILDKFIFENFHNSFSYGISYITTLGISFFFFHRFLTNELTRINQDDDVKIALKTFKDFLSSKDNLYYTLNALDEVRKITPNKNQQKNISKDIEKLTYNYKNDSLTFQDLLFFEKHHQTITSLNEFFKIESEKNLKNSTS